MLDGQAGLRLLRGTDDCVATHRCSRIKYGLQEKAFISDLDAKRDGGFAADCVEAICLMLQQDQPDDYLIATGECHSVREFLDEVFGHLGMDWHRYVEIDPRYFRPSEVDLLQGDASKARRILHWQPRVSFRELARMMVEADMKAAERERVMRDHDAKNGGSQ